MKRNLLIAIRFTVVTTIVFGLGYPLLVTGLSQWIFPKQANGSLIERNGQIVGSRLIGQGFAEDKYFHPRPSNAGNGYDPTASGGSNLGPTNQALVTRVQQDVAKWQQENPGMPVPADLVTSSGSGLDPDISPASAEFQVARVAKVRGISVDEVKQIVARHTLPRQFGILGEARVNVLELNLDLDASAPVKP
ncbi:MAG TPA: potassium-transporting ATPase subunit KdpC [Candidatus Acidoferrales bacterium]|jgi:K+-transporting ATPase ATPase C chain|nr:potassium-transporting ATPase subunit KdpC [Candidatus Acidoferrales bacterium]